ncbi:MAG: class I SAM-dependent methyltransferase [Nitrososphaeria archaeon]
MSWYGSHSFFNEYIRKNCSKTIMETGVLNGENAKTMIEAAVENFPPEQIEYYGFDFFDVYSLKQVERKLEKTGCKFKLFKGDIKRTLPTHVKTLPKMDLIFIDGGKSYYEANNDWKYSRILMHNRTAVFVHNYDFSGVQRMVNEIPRHEY